MAVISVLIPTRKRGEVLEKSIRSLVDNAANPSRIEIILGIDSDDPATREAIQNNIAPFLQEQSVECRANVFEPLGFANLHQYINTLANSSKGDWLFIWNDDAIMETKDWDNVVDQYDGQFKVLAPQDNHGNHPYAIFPIVPKDWYRLNEHVSQHHANDAWVSHIAYMLDIFQRVDINVLHDRADITGNNDDSVFKNRQSLEGSPDSAGDFGHPDLQQQRVKMTYKIAWFLDRIGQKSDWWQAVLEGKQDPFAKMIYPGGEGIAPPTPHSKPQPAGEATQKVRVDDSTTISL